MIRRYLKNRRPHRSHCVRVADDAVVQNGLALTPSQMMDMQDKGIPITTQNLGVTYDDGYSSLDFNVPLEYQRGIDMADLWEARENSKKKMRKAFSASVDREPALA